jgi:Zinc dependent phospholipase C
LGTVGKPLQLVRRLLFLFLLLAPWKLAGYAVLTHEAIIDTVWEKEIQPRILKRFPQSTANELVRAHAYAFGGCILQDMGYYPLGSKLFSDLVHYVRSGDFVIALLDQAQDRDEYAFALGAMAHYASDTEGHPLAVNRAVPIEYPKLRAKFGDTVTYADKPSAHLKTEFGFDVLQVARGHYAPQSYHDFIGFEVSKGLLARAIYATYAIKLEDLFTNVDLAVGTYRRTVSGIIPLATKVAWKLKKDEITKDQPGITRQRFLYNLSRASYHKEWSRTYQRPGIRASILAFFVRIIPKVGPFRALSFRAPTPETARMFEASFNATVDLYGRLARSVAEGHPLLSNVNLDTGKPVRAGEYSLADKTYGKFLRKLAERDFADVPEEIRRDILAFYGGGNKLTALTRDKDWLKTAAALDKLKAASGSSPQR